MTKSITKFAWVFVLFPLILGSCGGDRAKVEEARYLLGRGSLADAQKAASMLLPILENSTGEKKFEALELYVGAKSVEAGFDGIRTLTNLIYDNNSDNAASRMRDIVVNNGLSDAEQVAALNEALEQILAVVGTLHSETEEEIQEPSGETVTQQSASTEFQNASLEQQTTLYHQTAVLYLMRGILILLDFSGFSEVDAGAFVQSDCETIYTSSAFNDLVDEERVNSISLSLFRSRAYFYLSGLNDERLDAGDNNELIDLIDDFQTAGATPIDANRDGNIDAGTNSQRATRICQYLKDSDE